MYSAYLVSALRRVFLRVSGLFSVGVSVGSGQGSGEAQTHSLSLDPCMLTQARAHACTQPDGYLKKKKTPHFTDSEHEP